MENARELLYLEELLMKSLQVLENELFRMISTKLNASMCLEAPAANGAAQKRLSTGREGTLFQGLLPVEVS